MKIKLSNFELGWLVGILEGEGCFTYNNTQIVRIQMVDEDVMEAVRVLLSKITGKEIEMVECEEKRSNRQNTYAINVSGERARQIMKTVVPFMHFRRRQKIWQLLNKYVPPKQSYQEQLAMVSSVVQLARKSQ